MVIALNGSATMYCPLLTDIKIAKETGYDAIEITGSKLYRYLDQGLTLKNLLPHLESMPPVAVGYVQDIERQKPKEYSTLLKETEKMCSLAEKIGCPSVQLLTGPLGPGMSDYKGYMGLVGRPWSEVRDLTAKNLRVLADIGAKHNVGFYMEPLTWAPLHTLKQTIELIDATGRDNVGLVIDFWHQWTSGTRPDDIVRLDKKLIVGVHFCDSLPVPGKKVTQNLRQVWTGGGRIPLKEWVDAVVATGFDGWWSCELFSPRHWELDPWETARNLRELLKYMLV